MNEEMIKMLRGLMQHASPEEREAYDRFLESCFEAVRTHAPKSRATEEVPFHRPKEPKDEQP